MWVFKFNRTLGQLGLTLKYSGSHVLNMSLISGVIFIAYVTLMHTILGPHDPAYRFALLFFLFYLKVQNSKNFVRWLDAQLNCESSSA